MSKKKHPKRSHEPAGEAPPPAFDSDDDLEFGDEEFPFDMEASAGDEDSDDFDELTSRFERASWDAEDASQRWRPRERDDERRYGSKPPSRRSPFDRGSLGDEDS